MDMGAVLSMTEVMELRLMLSLRLKVGLKLARPGAAEVSGEERPGGVGALRVRGHRVEVCVGSHGCKCFSAGMRRERLLEAPSKGRVDIYL